MPPRGYCPFCVVETTDADEVEVADRGTITTFSVITPLQYHGQEENDDYVQGTLLLDGADTTIMVMRIDGVADRRGAHGHASRGGVATGRRSGGGGGGEFGPAAWVSATRWPVGRSTGEPDLTREEIAEHIL